MIDPKHTPRPDGRGGFPVLLLHGLFQSSGSFVTSEDRSLAFWLARQGGYQVYLGNTRGIFDMGHRNFSRNDPRFWGGCTVVGEKHWLMCRLDHPGASHVRPARFSGSRVQGNGVRQGEPAPPALTLSKMMYWVAQLTRRSPSSATRKVTVWRSSPSR